MCFTESRLVYERRAAQHVRDMCVHDVESLCLPHPLPPDVLMSPLLLMNDLSHWMDSMMEQTLLMPFDMMRIQIPLEDLQAAHIVSQVASHHPEESPEWVAQQVSRHGMEKEHMMGLPTEIRMLSRRLSEVTNQEVEQQTRGPFETHSINACMYSHFKERMLSSPCGQAINRLDHVRMRNKELLDRHSGRFEFDALSKLLLLYVMVLATVRITYMFVTFYLLFLTLTCTNGNVLLQGVVLFCRNRKDRHKNNRMRIRILRAIYSQPRLKAAVEAELGEPIGHVPPLSWRKLLKWGLYGQAHKRSLRKCRIIRRILSVALLVLICIDPWFALPWLLAFAIWMFCVATFTSPPPRACACCCCGLSTEDVKHGAVTKPQACCSCCNGTGVCSVSCTSCCDNKEDSPAKLTHGDYELMEGGCSCSRTCDNCAKGKCCGGDKCCNSCQCCSSSQKDKMEMVVCEGVPVQ
jgi:hypothetical protein